jgi:NADH-quinone oxidoreductase subunit K
MVDPKLFVTLGAILFAIGAIGAVVRKNMLVILMCIELMLNGAVLVFLAHAIQLNPHKDAMFPYAFLLSGQVTAFFVMAVAAAEAAVGLAIIVAVFRTARATSVDEVHLLKW